MDTGQLEALTLGQWAERSDESSRLAIESIARSTQLIAAIPFVVEPMKGIHRYVGHDGAHVTELMQPCGVDVYIQRKDLVGGGGESLLRSMKYMEAGQLAQRLFLDGEHAGETAAGLRQRVEGLGHSSLDAEGRITPSTMDRALDATTDPTHIWMSRLALRGMSAGLKALGSGSPLRWVMDGEIRRPEYRGIPVLTDSLGSAIPVDPTRAYVLSLGYPNGVYGIQASRPPARRVVDDGESVIRERIDWDAAITIRGPAAVAMIRNAAAPRPAAVV